MSDFKIFPSDKFDALTMLYLQAQDLSEVSPEQLFKMYADTHSRIKAQYIKSVKQKDQ